MRLKKIALSQAKAYQAIPMRKHTVALAALALIISCSFVLSATDTPETRRREAERYLQASPPKAMFENVADKMAATFLRINVSNSSE
jgi:hypothetical protein